jgi:molecular chaperone GrpE
MVNSNPDEEAMAQPSDRKAGTEEFENERLRGELHSEHELYLRTLADFDNYRRRIERERASATQAGKQELILQLLEVLDDFDHALEQMVDVPERISAGFVAIFRRLTSILQAQGIVPYESLGKRFDPALHEAIGMVESENAEPEIVVAEVTRGYRWGDKLLRPARVYVAR